MSKQASKSTATAAAVVALSRKAKQVIKSTNDALVASAATDAEALAAELAAIAAMSAAEAMHKALNSESTYAASVARLATLATAAKFIDDEAVLRLWTKDAVGLKYGFTAGAQWGREGNKARKAWGRLVKAIQAAGNESASTHETKAKAADPYKAPAGLAEAMAELLVGFSLDDVADYVAHAKQEAAKAEREQKAAAKAAAKAQKDAEKAAAKAQKDAAKGSAAAALKRLQEAEKRIVSVYVETKKADDKAASDAKAKANGAAKKAAKAAAAAAKIAAQETAAAKAKRQLDTEARLFKAAMNGSASANV